MKLLLWFLAILSFCLAAQSGTNSSPALNESVALTLSKQDIRDLKMRNGLIITKAIIHGIIFGSCAQLKFTGLALPSLIKTTLLFNGVLMTAEIFIKVYLRYQLHRIPSELVRRQDEIFWIFLSLFKQLSIALVVFNLEDFDSRFLSEFCSLLMLCSFFQMDAFKIWKKILRAFGVLKEKD